MGWQFGQSYSQDLRDPVLGAVDGGTSVRVAAATFGVIIAYICKVLMRRRLTGSAETNPNRGHHPRKLSDEQEDALTVHIARVPASRRRRCNPGCWPNMVCNSAAARPGMRCSGSDCRLKRALRAAEQDRPDVAARRNLWRAAQPFIDPESLVIFDETGVNIKLARAYGWAPVGERCRDSMPFGHWKTRSGTGIGDSLRQAQDAAATGTGKDRLRPHPAHRQFARSIPADRMRQLLPRRRLTTLNLKML
ncbi:hypothetical protein [Sphingomonas sp. BK345]|uniref:hypothetical protein n=1 Tax=Sphingomonas sp. BK345 TaxID=2586980 RepID=UPI00160EB868|nr:hypothetical protein [Sphingomonas sp. BK345]MBB3473635.1 hypothetical protein [Sphingomonas sp. BK345]